MVHQPIIREAGRPVYAPLNDAFVGIDEHQPIANNYFDEDLAEGDAA